MLTSLNKRSVNMHISPPPPVTPRRAGRLRDAVAYSGIGRSKLYELATRHPGLFKKNGKAILVDFRVLDQILDTLPVAKIEGRTIVGAGR
jgi:hypothetical protein